MDKYDFPLPPNSFPCLYQESESSQEPSTPTSPMESTYISYPGIDPTFDHGDISAESTPSESSQGTTQKPKRKRENRYKNAPPSVLSRRRAQNRASQRAYRERKDQRIKDLEDLLNEAQQRNDVLSQAYAGLQADFMKLKSEQDLAAAVQYQQLGISFDPTMTGPPTTSQIDGFESELYLCEAPTMYNI
ncbi:hypothetical protein PFICI_06310 [Pestalotiopsis fici W106-1]|uniref:Putative transcription factor kapC n=1 Tax=Pestalotiopsis fici (strain W106-1 / CGMCC3.15140) TaxID=1229662 RepID=W3X5C3_PESFW|nr:uncharacterized protein PFICI_06310 [Pestalotiopsis fici W106-1]ETS81308.1 hypothetical protein PFICI_06310 [Pestalotiopsis fici W106-1]